MGKDLQGQEKDALYSNDIITIAKWLEDSDLLIDGATEIVKYEIKKQEGGFLPAMMEPMATSMIAPMVSSLINAISGKSKSRENRKRTTRWISSVISIIFNDKSSEKSSHKSWKMI